MDLKKPEVQDILTLLFLCPLFMHGNWDISLLRDSKLLLPEQKGKSSLDLYSY